MQENPWQENGEEKQPTIDSTEHWTKSTPAGIKHRNPGITFTQHMKRKGKIQAQARKEGWQEGIGKQADDERCRWHIKPVPVSAFSSSSISPQLPPRLTLNKFDRRRFLRLWVGVELGVGRSLPPPLLPSGGFSCQGIVGRGSRCQG